MKNFGKSLLELWKQLGLNQRVSLTVASLAVVAGLVAIALWSRRPDYQLLYGNLGDKDAAAIISYLEAQNVPHQVTAGGTAVEVPTDQVYKLRMDLAGKGLPGGDGVGFEIFDKGQFGLSDFVQRTNYLRAVQGELARTITQLAGVRAARVMIVQPENRLLLTDQNVKSTASVFVDLGGGRLDPDQVNAIRHLVANSVQGLQPDEVAVVDNHGHTISEDLKQDPTLGTASSQMRYRQQVEDYFAKKVESMLAQVIGPGNAVVRVSADIDTEATTVTEEKFDPEGQVARSETTTDDKSKSVEARASGGAVGVSSNVPDKPGAGTTDGARPTSTTDSDRINKTTTYEINRTVTNTTRSPGRITSLTASVFIAPGPAGKDGAVPKRSDEEIKNLRLMVIDALGLKASPGQNLDNLVTLQEMTFAPAPAIEQLQALQAESRWPAWAEAASRYAAIGGAALVLLLFVRILSQQKPEPVPVEVLTLPPEVAARSLPSGNNVTPDMVNELIRQKPTNVGVALRGWVAASAATKN
jgi:flagellar M-ring protein FliF